MSRYDHLGPVYDVVSFERLLYRRPRARLLELLGPLPGATVLDVGCGTGVNLELLRRAVHPGGRVVGVDASASMLAAANRRIRRHGWPDVQLVAGTVADLDAALRSASVDVDQVGGIVATFVLSLLPDDGGFWRTVDRLAELRPRRVGIADLGPPHAAPPVLRPLLSSLTAAGGGDPARRPWERLASRAVDVVHEVRLGGHVHLAVGTIHSPDALRDPS